MLEDSRYPTCVEALVFLRIGIDNLHDHSPLFCTKKETTKVTFDFAQKCLDIPMVFHGISWFNSMSWYFMVFHGISWYFLVFHGISWYFMVFHFISWCFLVFLGISWYFMVFHGVSWYFLVFHDISWYFMVFLGISWYFLVFHGISWYFMVESLRPMVEGSLTSRSPPKQIHNQIRKP